MSPRFLSHNPARPISWSCVALWAGVVFMAYMFFVSHSDGFWRDLAGFGFAMALCASLYGLIAGARAVWRGRL